MIAKIKDIVSKNETNKLKSLEYVNFLKDLKFRIKSSQLKASVKVNKELIKLYWEIGSSLNIKIRKDGWGAKVLEKLAKDLKVAFPNLKGFSFRNLKYMTRFAREYVGDEIGQQAVAQIPWGHNILIMQKISDAKERLWYADMTLSESWSRSSLEDVIKAKYYQRHGKSITNFKKCLPSPQSELAQQMLKDPYNFDFLTLADGYREKELEDGLLKHIRKFLLELGHGFAFIGQQFPVNIGGDDYFIDLLFYNYKLHSFCVIELKTSKFIAEYAGKMNMYLSAVDDLLKKDNDNPSIGMILCKTKNNYKVEYALRDINKPIGVSGYETKILESLPNDLKGTLPTVEEFEEEFLKSQTL
jgi:predicted nuclease of restriction endonuclease-like (RecB) superfamily